MKCENSQQEHRKMHHRETFDRTLRRFWVHPLLQRRDGEFCLRIQEMTLHHGWFRKYFYNLCLNTWCWETHIMNLKSLPHNHHDWLVRLFAVLMLKSMSMWKIIERLFCSMVLGQYSCTWFTPESRMTNKDMNMGIIWVKRKCQFVNTSIKPARLAGDHSPLAK